MSFFKNILTFGGSGKLEKEKAQLNQLVRFYRQLYPNYEMLVENRTYALYNLNEERDEALTNFVLLKTLISSVIKNMNSSKSDVNEDILSQQIILDINNNKIDDSIEFQQSIDRSIHNISESVGLAFDRLNTKIEKGEQLSNKDLKNEAYAVGVTLIGEGINQIFNMNTEVNRQRAEVQANIEKLNNTIQRISNSYANIYAESLRIDELFENLNQNNQRFVRKYKNIVETYFINYDLTKFSNTYISSKDNFQKDLDNLTAITSEYNKVKKVNVVC